MVKKLLILLLSSTGLVAFGQNLDRMYKAAEAKFLTEDLINARVLYQNVVDQDPSYKDSQYRLEICDQLTTQRNEPIDKMLSYRSTYGKSDKFYNFWLGRIYADKYQFRDAIRIWNLFMSDDNYVTKELRGEVTKLIEECERLIIVFENPDEYEIHQLGSDVNTRFDELTPVFFEERQELLFASSRDSEDTIEPTYLIYHSSQSGKNWSKPVAIESLGSFEEGEANLELIDQDGKLFQFRPDQGGDLYYSEAMEDGWSEPKEFDNSITKAHIRSHFFINERENRVIFASEQFYKQEGLELYHSYHDPNDGGWSSPTILSTAISSTWDEDTPYLSPDEKSIYFSSNRPGGVGGYDVYVSRLNEENSTWSEPVNMGFPINSPDDELHFKMNPDLKSGYFSSNRYQSNGRYDIYFFWEIEKVNVIGRITDLSTGLPAKNVSISFRPSQYEDEYFRSEVDAAGNYLVRIVSEETFTVEIQRNGQIIYSDEYEVHATGGVETTRHQDFFIEGGEVVDQDAHYAGPAETEVKVEELGSKFRTGRTAIIRNIYFDHGTSQLKENSTTALQVLLKTMRNSPTLQIEVAGHTDSTGAADVNEWLSLKRAMAIQKWLSKNGIESSRIVPKGYGESKPIASNDDEEDGRELNRRIEIIVIE